MANDFDRYRKAKQIHDGRIDQKSTWPGWIAVGVLGLICIGAWLYALPTYQSVFSGEFDYPSSANQTAEISQSSPPQTNQSQRTDNNSTIKRPQQPGFLLREREPDEMAAVFFDIGQGDAIFLQTPGGKNLLIDSGEGQNPPAHISRKIDAANQFLIPFFKRNGINKLHYYITSHPHSDHLGSAPSLVKNMPIDQVWIAGNDHDNESKKIMLETIKEKDIRLRAPKAAGGNITEGMEINNLGPGVKGWNLRTAPNDEDVNNSSLVQMFHYGDNSLLLTGDIEGTREGGGFGEQELLRKWGDQLDVDILKVSHHGSRFSTTREFLQYVQPEYSVIQVGHYNTFGHPTPETLSRLENVDSEIYRNDQDGTIFMFMDGENIRVHTRRDMSAVN